MSGDDDIIWTKSSFSGDSGACVEVSCEAEFVYVRDSKNLNSPELAFTPDEWVAFIKGVKAGEFDLS